ncbi:hypothetical protein VC36_16825 [Pseudomonas marginalis]|nr:hypothetical protein VC37_12305 [Pseudomonas marginalis]KJZ58405.1 hypothetical protein VC36_16825 [Pseudomonas marginalis]
MPSDMRQRQYVLSLSTLWRRSDRTRTSIRVGYRRAWTVGANSGRSKAWISHPVMHSTIPNTGKITAFGIVQALVRIPNQARTLTFPAPFGIRTLPVLY